MSDNRSIIGEPDRSLINTNEDHEIKYWCTRFAVSSEKLIEAVNKVGNSVSKVEKYLD